jgi:uncharacterized membrane protein
MFKNKQIADELIVVIIGIIAVFALEVIALLKGVDGQFFGLAVAGIGGIIGWVAKMFRDSLKSKK